MAHVIIMSHLSTYPNILFACATMVLYLFYLFYHLFT